MAERSPKGCLIAAFLWIVILGILAVAAKYYILPKYQKDLETKTSSPSRFQNEIIVDTDSFSGYCILRSPKMREDLESQGTKLTIRNDNGDYTGRMKALQDGKSQMAVYTVDSFVVAGAGLGEYPAAIVMAIDETKGADAIVTYKDAVSKLEDLNSPNARIVLTPNSPSEFLARTIIAHFSLPNLPEKWWTEAKGAGDVYQKFKAADRNAKTAYVLWEPYVSKALEVDGAYLLMDSSKLKGYIVDVLVAERKFLRDKPDLAKAFIEAYLRATYNYSSDPNGMRNLVVQDAAQSGGEPLSEKQAEKLVQGIQWKNTLENYAHFGLIPREESQGARTMEMILSDITGVLVKTGAVASDPIAGKANTLFYDKPLRDLKALNFHPGRKVNIIEGVGPDTKDLERIHAEAPARALTEAEWDSLVPIGQMRVNPIVFARGTAGVNSEATRNLDELVRNLEAWPQYYLQVVGHSRSEGDPEANLKLARERADAVVNYIVSKGAEKNRIRTKTTPPSNEGGASQSVSFDLGQLPY